MQYAELSSLLRCYVNKKELTAYRQPESVIQQKLNQRSDIDIMENEYNFRYLNLNEVEEVGDGVWANALGAIAGGYAGGYGFLAAGGDSPGGFLAAVGGGAAAGAFSPINGIAGAARAIGGGVAAGFVSEFISSEY